jgi:hypothetical protein
LTDDGAVQLEIAWDSILLLQFIKENSRTQDGVSGVDTLQVSAFSL